MLYQQMGCGHHKIEASSVPSALEGRRAPASNHTAPHTPPPDKPPTETTAFASNIRVRKAPKVGLLQTKTLAQEQPQKSTAMPDNQADAKIRAAGGETGRTIVLQRRSHCSQSDFSAAPNRHSHIVALVKLEHPPLYFSASDAKDGSGRDLAIIPNKKRYRLETVDRDYSSHLGDHHCHTGREPTARIGDHQVALGGRGLDSQGLAQQSLKAAAAQPGSNCEAGSLKSETEQRRPGFVLPQTSLRLIKMASSELRRHSEQPDGLAAHSKTPTSRPNNSCAREDVCSSKKAFEEALVPPMSEYSANARKRFKERQLIDNRARAFLPPLKAFCKAKPRGDSLSPGVSPCSERTGRRD